MRTFFITLLTVVMRLFVDFVLFELAAILLAGNAAEAGVGQIFIRFAFLWGNITLMVAILRRGSK